MQHIDTQRLLADIEEVLQRHGLSGVVNIAQVRIMDNWWKENDNIYESHEEWFEDVFVDKKAWLQYRYRPLDDFKPGEVNVLADAIEDWLENRDEDDTKVDSLRKKLLKLNMKEIQKKYPDLHDHLTETLQEFLEESDWEEIVESGILPAVYGINCPDEEFNELEALSMWTVYYSPPRGKVDKATAFRCGLIPFEYQGTEYVALGGSGMDLSPQLDAYQALTDRSLPSDSQFLRSSDYAKYVVGEDLFNEVMRAVAYDPVITIRTYRKNNSHN